MPAAIPAIAAAWASVSAAVATVGTALAFKAGIVAGLAAWGKVALVTTVLSTALMLKPPSLGSQGQQVNIQMAGPSAALPWIFGRTGTQGIITYRATYGGGNAVLLAEHVLSVGPVASIESFSVMGRSLTYSGHPASGMAEVVQVAGVNMRESKLFRYGGLKVAYRPGAHNDNSTLASITGDPVPGITSSHTMPGLARGILRCQLDEKRLNFPQGYPDDPIWVIRGAECYDPRKDSTYSQGGSGSHRLTNASTHEWSENPFIVGLQFALGIRSPNGEVMFGLGLDPDMIDIPAWVAAANVADANNWKVGGQVVSTDDEWPAMVNILASGGGVPIDRGGRLSCFVRSPKVATFNLAADEVLGSRRVTTSTPMSQRFNRIIPSCRQENQKWEMIAGQPVADPSWLAQDGGEVRTEEIAFPLVNDFRQAHQLAAYYACDSREFLETELTAKPRALNVDVGECISVDLPEFPVGQTFIVMGRKWNPETATVTLNLKAETFEKHAFCLGQSQVAPTPPTLNKFDPNRPAAPLAGDWSVVDNKIVQTKTEIVVGEDGEEVEITRDQAIVPALVISGQVRDPNVQKVIVEYREPLAEDVVIPEDEDAIDFGWTYGAEGIRTATDFQITGLKPNTAFEVSVSFETVTGAFSNRLVLPVTITAQDQAGGLGPGTVDWEKPDGEGPIINRPPILTDTEFLNSLKPSLDALDNAVSDLGNATVDLDHRVSDAANTVTSVQGRIDDVYGVVGVDDTKGLRARLIRVENSQTGDLTTITNRVTGLETREAGAIGRITTIEEAVANLDGTYVKASRIDQIDATIGAMGGRISTVEDASADLAAGLSEANRVIQLKANQTGLDGLVTRVDQVSTVANAAATASALSAVSGGLAIEKGRIDGAITRLDAVEIKANGAATVQSVTNVGLRVDTEKGRIDGAIGRLDAVEIKANNAATVQSVTNVGLRVDTEKGRIDGAIGRLDAVEIKANGAATVQSVTNLGLKVDGYDARITTADSIARSADGRIKLISGVVQDVNGYVTGITSENTGTSSAVKIRSDKLEISAPGGGARTEFSQGAWKIYDAANRKRIHLGLKAA